MYAPSCGLQLNSVQLNFLPAAVFTSGRHEPQPVPAPVAEQTSCSSSTSLGYFIADIIGPYIIAAAYQFTQHRFGLVAAAQQLQALSR
jgi:hypothetical protein